MSVTISPKFQVVIPKEVREKLKWTPGQKLDVLAVGNTVRLIPVRPLKDLRGILKGIDTNFKREKRDRNL